MPISPDSDYCLDGSVSLLLMTVDIEAGARRSRIDVDGIADRYQGYRPEQPDFFSEEVTRQVLHWRSHHAGPMDRAHLAWAGLLGSEHQFAEVIGSTANQLVDLHLDAIGAPRDRIFSRSPPAGLSDLVLTDPSDLSRPENVERVLRYGSTGAWLAAMEAQYERILEGLEEVSHASYAEVLRHEYDVVRPAEHARLMAALDARRPAAVRPTQARLNQRQGRKAARKGMRLYGQLFGEEGIRTFVRGDTLQIKGVQFDYRVRKTISIVDHSARPTSGHIPYQLDIYDKSGAFLAGGCVYFQDTPVIDQIIGLSLHVRDREDELIFLQSTNMLRRGDAYYDDPVLPDLKNDRRPGTALEPSLGLNGCRDPEMEAAEDRLRLMAKQAVTALLPQVMAIPPQALRVLQRPPLRADEIERLSLSDLSRSLSSTLLALQA